MLRSMNSAISGMQAFQTMLDVVGNNIANVNTVGFKSSSTNFSDILSQTIAGGNGPTTGGIGGTNPQQVGLGVKVAAIQTQFTQGADQTTGNPTDLAINGSGLFIVSPGNTTPSYTSSTSTWGTAPSSQPTPLYYTRAGDFTVDSNNNLVLPNGMTVVGTPVGSSPSPSLQSVNLDYFMHLYNTANGTSLTLSSSPDVQIGSDGSISVTASDGNRYTIGHLMLANFANPAGLAKAGDSMYSAASNSGAPVYNQPQSNNAGSLMAGALEMSNVDLTQEMSNMIVAENGFAANSHIIGTDNTILNDVMNMKNS
ncbi:flagellar hook-basal body complex protein [Alicyclobacillus tolerans]|uniref:flagellar hook-basal body complex protein n=1 Tax=Alicyclobacillus tolerans TaxID=90970 RepID=UPI001F1AD139|nr:flagellar hook-basal body complex protein [Alicyclobacillus tolerans]MCF8564760.1 flagellar hook-basal body complex protein [Alicyclobacillus tolerans]